MRIRAVLRLKHEVLLAAMEERGWTQLDLARAAGVSANSICAAVNLGFQRVGAGVARKIAEALDLLPEEVVPPEVARQKIENAFNRTMEVSNAKLLAMDRREHALLAADPGSVASDKETLDRALDAMTERERLVATMRADGSTFLQIGRVLGVSVERVRQLHWRALAKARQRLGLDESTGEEIDG